jgi:hypothetical protein
VELLCRPLRASAVGKVDKGAEAALHLAHAGQLAVGVEGVPQVVLSDVRAHAAHIQRGDAPGQHNAQHTVIAAGIHRA